MSLVVRNLGVSLPADGCRCGEDEGNDRFHLEQGFEEVRDQLHAVFRPGIAAESNEGGTVRTIFLERFVQEAEESLVILGRFADPVGLNPNGLIELWAGTD